LKRFFYALFFIALNILYLIIELSFNAYLLDISASMSALTDLDHLELYGRSISAAGATLLFWRLLIPYKKNLSVSKTLFKFLLISIIVYPTVFLGQKKLIDYMVDSSTAEMRRSAEVLNVLKFGIAHGFVEIDELTLDDLTLETAEGKMFVVLAGLLIYSTNDELKKIDNQLNVIAQYATTTQEMQNTQSSYRDYQYASLKIIEKYRQYAQIVEDYDKQQQCSRKKSISIYQQAIAKALDHWSSYSIKKLDLEYLYQQKESSLILLINQLNQSLSECHKQQCAKKKSVRIIASINQLLGAQSNWLHWCDEDAEKTIVHCSSDANVVAYKLQKITERYLVQQFGFERYYTNKLDFMQSREFYDLFLLSLEKNDVPLSSELPLTQHSLIIDEINLHISQFLKQQYQVKMIALMGIDVRPRLSMGQFTLLPDMQKLYQKALGVLYKQPLPIAMSRQMFLKKMVQPLYQQQQAFLSNKLTSDSSWYEQGAPYAESGKSSLRKLVVPPVAIAMSLVFGILNLISLLLNISFLLIKESSIKRWFGFIFLMLAFMLAPLFKQYVIADQSAFEKLMSYTQKDYAMGIEMAQWIIKVEPMVYSIGNILRVNVLDGFEFD